LRDFTSPAPWQFEHGRAERPFERLLNALGHDDQAKVVERENFVGDLSCRRALASLHYSLTVRRSSMSIKSARIAARSRQANLAGYFVDSFKIRLSDRIFKRVGAGPTKFAGVDVD